MDERRKWKDIHSEEGHKKYEEINNHLRPTFNGDPSDI